MDYPIKLYGVKTVPYRTHLSEPKNAAWMLEQELSAETVGVWRFNPAVKESYGGIDRFDVTSSFTQKLRGDNTTHFSSWAEGKGSQQGTWIEEKAEHLELMLYTLRAINRLDYVQVMILPTHEELRTAVGVR